jgi:DNA helicase-2/ATP-dependent DNA helicase PcrA
VPRDRFNAARYEGSDGDERRLFYVALTRARDWLSVSRHGRVKTRAVAASPYYLELARLEAEPQDVVVAPIKADDRDADDPISITYSELAAFIGCGLAFRLRNLIGFQQGLLRSWVTGRPCTM